MVPGQIFSGTDCSVQNSTWDLIRSPRVRFCDQDRQCYNENAGGRQTKMASARCGSQFRLPYRVSFNSNVGEKNPARVEAW